MLYKCQEKTVVLFLVWLILMKCTLHGTDSFFFFRSRFIYSKSPQVTFLTESRLQVDFKSVLVQVKSVSPNKVTPRSANLKLFPFVAENYMYYIYIFIHHEEKYNFT